MHACARCASSSTLSMCLILQVRVKVKRQFCLWSNSAWSGLIVTREIIALCRVKRLTKEGEREGAAIAFKKGRDILSSVYGDATCHLVEKNSVLFTFRDTESLRRWKYLVESSVDIQKCPLRSTGSAGGLSCFSKSGNRVGKRLGHQGLFLCALETV